MKTTFYHWLNQWLEVYCKQTVRENTYKCYAAAIANVKKCLSDRPLQDLLEVDLQTGLNLLCDMGYSKSSIRKVVIVVHAAYKAAMHNGLANMNPATYVKVPAEAPEKDIRALTLKEQELVEKFCKSDLHGDLILFLLYSGLRRQELCNLKWIDFDEHRNCIYIRKSKTKSGVRRLPLHPLCVCIIRSQPKINEFIFNTSRQTPISPSSLHKTYLRLRKITGVEFLTNHVCRHTFATRLIENGADPAAVAELLGHASAGFTLNRYVHSQFEHLEKQVYLLPLRTA